MKELKKIKNKKPIKKKFRFMGLSGPARLGNSSIIYIFSLFDH